ncbi:MAG: DUF4442 domain-containing protein [Candidatus Hydrogenedentes bacterium]|nr:DUF4442 domain-containing protein [Candidatus Hydrogenedentota bacterium]
MSESWRTRLFRWGFRLFPCYRGTGGRVTYITRDWREIRAELPLNWRTRNYVGTIFGGSMYGFVDPLYMLMLIKVLGPEYVVWDKAASIRFKRPGRSRLHATCRLSEEEISAIKTALESASSVDRTYQVEVTDRDGTVCAIVEKVIYVSRREAQKKSGNS